MKDQKHTQGHDQHDEKSTHKDPTHAKGVDQKTHEELPKSASTRTEGSGSQGADKSAKLKEAGTSDQFLGVDHAQVSNFHDAMTKDDVLKQKFIQDPHGIMKQQGINVPEGIRATYDHQYVKPSDGSKAGMYGYRIGNVSFSK